MEYEFKSGLTGERLAQMSMGHEAFGRLLTEELNRPEAVEQLLQQLQAPLSDPFEVRQLLLGEWALVLEQGEVDLKATALGMEQDHDLDPDIEYYDVESEACCGLEDLCQLLSSWHTFLGTGRRRQL
ncbi:hypothetical protein SAMN04488540_11075 [Ferrimonas sediminum]|uniref:Uncharacterized protein n=1 Tax=Ferrimonas sediminum TaxID=718193 RepID=A0A1G8V258_9GAMM|nr:YacL family protein [Ferrimonas sediminum]SDJ60143.1 hypothetical protein SAMN04488540_11075 [Ferrimonas sediminum]